MHEYLVVWCEKPPENFSPFFRSSSRLSFSLCAASETGPPLVGRLWTSMSSTGRDGGEASGASRAGMGGVGDSAQPVDDVGAVGAVGSGRRPPGSLPRQAGRGESQAGQPETAPAAPPRAGNCRREDSSQSCRRINRCERGLRVEGRRP